MTWVKICGITNLEDALTAVEAGADALGFVFYERSPRKAKIETPRDIIRQLPDRIEKVGVFVDDEPERIREIASQAGLTTVQLHGRRALEKVWKDERPAEQVVGVSKVIPVIPGDSLKNGGVLINERVYDNVFALLFDSQSNGEVGGTGTTFDWRGTRAMVQVISLKLPVIVAGGLTALNVSEAIRLLQPFGVDVSSGVEALPGKKDAAKVDAFIQAVRGANKTT
ncbi:MAG TPA: phosphoribosylanthranilate isomerase [Terriglobales bacterium]|nr:phosphoribosylanthranilate isomerase [Terriglobales bacterium]